MSTYWTLQTAEVWEQFKKQGYLEGTKEYAMYPKEYTWMMKQMNKRLTNYKGEYPFWLWIKKPDMRSTGHFSSYTQCVRLRLDLNDRDVLVSDFDDWHMVLNNTFNADNEEESNAFYDNKLSISKEESWLRIFDLERKRDPVWHGIQERRLQGVTGRISLSNVKKVENFISRKQSELLYLGNA